MSSRKMFVAIMALFTAVMIVAVSLTETDLAEGLVEEAQVLRIEQVPILETTSFDEIRIEIETKITNTEEETEVTEELTTEVKLIETPTTSTRKNNYAKKTTTTTEPRIEEVTEAVEYVDLDPAEEATELISSETVSEETTEAPSRSMYYSMTDDEIYIFAALIYLEAGSTSYKCQCAVASVVLNLMVDEGKSLRQCINTPGRFSVANRVYKTKPSNTSLEVARKIATDGPTLPTYVLYFRNNHYFSWAEPYCNIDNVYFSY